MSTATGKARLATIIPVLLLVAAFAGNVLQWQANNQLRQRLSPEIECRYKFLAESLNHKVCIINTGPVPATDIWFSEEVFLLDEVGVYSGDDVPHYDYFVYEGSRKGMFDLEPGQAWEQELVEHQLEAFARLGQKYSFVPVVKWWVAFSKEGLSKRYAQEAYFVYDRSELRFRPLAEHVGGDSLRQRVRQYVSSGAKRSVRIFDLTGDFEIDPPPAYIVKSDTTVLGLYPWTKVTIEDFNSALFTNLGRAELQPSDDVSAGSIRYRWQVRDGRWEKTVLLVGQAVAYSKIIPLPVHYLTWEDAQRAKNNPTLLKSSPVTQSDIRQMRTLLRKAAIKYGRAMGGPPFVAHQQGKRGGGVSPAAE